MDRLFAKETEVRKRWGENEMKKKIQALGDMIGKIKKGERYKRSRKRSKREKGVQKPR
jgi:hypothetical protein